MAFEYGAQKLNIRNPFRFEGLVRSIRGAILLAIGVYLLFQIQPLLGTDKPRAWVNLLIGGLFVTGGLKALGGGLFQVMRFFVGRAAPAERGPWQLMAQHFRAVYLRHREHDVARALVAARATRAASGTERDAPPQGPRQALDAPRRR